MLRILVATTTDSRLLQQLKRNLMAAAFQGLADPLPENLEPCANALRNAGARPERLRETRRSWTVESPPQASPMSRLPS